MGTAARKSATDPTPLLRCGRFSGINNFQFVPWLCLIFRGFTMVNLGYFTNIFIVFVRGGSPEVVTPPLWEAILSVVSIGTDKNGIRRLIPIIPTLTNHQTNKTA